MAERMTLEELGKVDGGRYIVLRNAIKDPHYRPYCMRCPGLDRMVKMATFYWRCQCGAVHDERETLVEEEIPKNEPKPRQPHLELKMRRRYPLR